MARSANRPADYDEYLRTPEWQALRQLALKRDGNRCVVCNGAKRLNVHHRTYKRLGHEDLADLTTLCGDCHELFHDAHPGGSGLKRPPKRQRKVVTRQASPGELEPPKHRDYAEGKRLLDRDDQEGVLLPGGQRIPWHERV